MQTARRFFSLLVVAAFALAALTSPRADAQQATDQSPQANDEAATIVAVLKNQVAAWNRGDIVEFMQTYWKDDRLTFSGGGKTTYGWQATLENYQKNYPREKMGQLHFDHISFQSLGSDAALVLGDWHLDLDGQKKDGNFSIVLRKFGDRWLIIHDHSSTKNAKE